MVARHPGTVPQVSMHPLSLPEVTIVSNILASKVPSCLFLNNTVIIYGSVVALLIGMTPISKLRPKKNRRLIYSKKNHLADFY